MKVYHGDENWSIERKLIDMIEGYQFDHNYIDEILNCVKES